MPYSLTPAMADAARVIAELTAIEGRPPGFRAIGREMCLGLRRTYELVLALEEREWIARDGRGRIARVLHPPPPAVLGPLEVTEAGRAWLEDAA